MIDNWQYAGLTYVLNRETSAYSSELQIIKNMEKVHVCTTLSFVLKGGTWIIFQAKNLHILKNKTVI